ncbi:hypothetical protein N7461_002203 [Penicillium sp. DV-2018c]|nr:hypothetical protein N7461_002203 [Penicillium sp. DV-2018c]
MPQHQAPDSHPPIQKTTAARLLANSLSETTRETTALTSQAHNEVGLLLAALITTETYVSSLDTDCAHLAVLNISLQSCHEALLELQTLQSQPDMVGAQSQVSEIRARLSLGTSALNEVNNDIDDVSCRRDIERAVSCLVDDIAAGRQDVSLVTNALTDCSTPEKDGAWTRLQKALAAAGIPPQLSSENHSLIMSILQKFYKVDAPSTAEKQLASTDRISEPMESTPVQSNSREKFDDENWLADEPTGLPFLPLPPKGLSYSDGRGSYMEQSQPYPEKQVLLEENFPIPVPTEIEDPTDTPIPLMMEIQDSTDSQKEVLPTQPSENLPIPVFTPPSPSPIPRKPDLTRFRVLPNPKRPNRLCRLLWTLTHSKQPFITSIITNNYTLVQSHLQTGANPNIQNTSSQTP